MPTIPFPNVPLLPGVPLIPRMAGVTLPAPARIPFAVAQEVLWQIFQSRFVWGVFGPDGRPLGNPAAFVPIIGSVLSTNSVDYSKGHRVSDFPVEAGGFASYNKVELPSNPVVTLAMSGTESDRASFLSEIDAATRSLVFYDVVTPEAVYIKHSIEGYAYQRRNDKGSGLLVVELSLIEVREVSAQYTRSDSSAGAASQIESPTDPGSVPTVDSGRVQASEVSPPVKKKASLLFNLVGR